MRDVLFEEVFRLLEEATFLEKNGQHRIEAATKYYESCYLMRQIVATAEAKLVDESNHSGHDTAEKTIGVSSCRLLKDKIDHYTSVARKLYFDESAAILPQQEEESEPDGKPATSVIIGLLDDAISVLTETRPIPPLVPVLGYNEKTPTNGNKMSTGHRQNNIKNNPKPQAKQRSGRTPRCALAVIERRIHLRANLAHSTLSKAIDLDERHRMGQNNNNNNNNNTRQKAIASYVEASELYLSAIQLGKEQEQKLESLSNKKPSTRSCSSAALIETMQACLTGLLKKLKRLLGSALDRVEALKQEEEKCYPEELLNAVVSVAGASISAATPVASNVYKSTVHWFSAKENDWNQSNQEKGNEMAPQSRRQSPTTVLW